MDDANRSLRLLTIYSGLLNGKVLRKKELADKYGTSERTIQRDISDIQRFFAENAVENGEVNEVIYDMYEASRQVANAEIDKKIEIAREESIAIYDRLEECDIKTYSVRDDLEKINHMFCMNINFEDDWLKFIGVHV